MNAGWNWLAELSEILATGKRAIRIVVAEAEGSTPREAGAGMIVTATNCRGTIGGGRLEHEAACAAQKLLASSTPPWHRELHQFPLGPALGQCCGGRAALLFEAFGPAEAEAISAAAAVALPIIVARPAVAGVPLLFLADRQQRPNLPLPVLRASRDILSGIRPCEPAVIRLSKSQAPWLVEPSLRPRTPVYLYGAGHVGRAVVRALEPLPFDIKWIDVDRRRFPNEIPSAVEAIAESSPTRMAAEAPTGAFHLVMTFSHPLDLDICHAILRRGEFAYLGLIGSDTKAMRFKKRLLEAGIPAAGIDRLICPIGLPGVPGKAPAMIAASVAADLLIRATAAMTVARGGRETLRR